MAAANIKLVDLNGGAVDSAELSADFRGAEKNGPIWVGQTGLYYRSGLKKVYIPISQIDHAYTRVREIETHVCCGGYTMYTYSLVLASNGRDLCEISCEQNENYVTRSQELLLTRNGAIRTEYTQADKDARLSAIKTMA